MLMKMRSTGCVPAASVENKGGLGRDTAEKSSPNPGPEAEGPEIPRETLEKDGRKTPYIIEETLPKPLPMEDGNGKKGDHFFHC